MPFARNISRLFSSSAHRTPLNLATLRHGSTSEGSNVPPAVDTLERTDAPSLTPESVREISNPNEKLTQSKALFSSLAAPTSLPAGRFRGDFVGLFTDSALIKLAVPTLWDGVRFSGRNATILVNPWLSWMLPKEVGTASIAESIYDEGKALRVDFQDRFWESRKVDENRFLSIVTNKESGEVMDVHTLTRDED